MTPPRETRWAIQPHTVIKHLILRKYLDAWLPIMARYNGRIVFIDGFAGPGRYTGGEEGSPLIALRAVLGPPHFASTASAEVVFFFIERDAARGDALRSELARLRTERPFPAWIRVEVVEASFADEMTALLDAMDEGATRLAPTFAFLDPFGFAGIPMGVIARIAANPRCECFITFMYESVNRFLGHPEDGITAHFDDLFGTRDWRDLLELREGDERRDGIISLYARQLQTVGGFRYVRAFEMVNQGNRTEYFLFFGTNNPRGLSKMKQAMWRADPASGSVFSDRTDTAQMILLTVGAEAQLPEMLTAHFRGRGSVSIEEVERFILEETPFSEAIHLKRKTLMPMERAAPPLIRVRRPPGMRKGTYPTGTTIRFV